MDIKTIQENRKKVIKELDKLVKMGYTGLPCRDYQIIRATRDCIEILYQNEELKNVNKKV